MDDNETKQREFKKYLSIQTLMAMPFLSLNFYDRLFFIVYVLLSIALLVYKDQRYPFAGYALTTEIIILVSFSVVQLVRYYLAERAVLDKDPTKAIVFVLLSVFSILGFVFGIRLQTYVLLMEIVTNSIGLVFTVAEIVCALWVWKVSQRKKQTY